MIVHLANLHLEIVILIARPYFQQGHVFDHLKVAFV
jgi:hypothetical protein